MIDYYLHKKCVLTKSIMQQKEDIRCKGCVWLDYEIHKCIFSLDYPKTVSIEEMRKRIYDVDLKQQEKLFQSFRRFIL